MKKLFSILAMMVMFVISTFAQRDYIGIKALNQDINVSQKDSSHAPDDRDIVGETFNEGDSFTCPDALCFTAKEAGAKISLVTEGTISNVPKLVFSTDGKKAYTYYIGGEITLENAGDKVYFCAKDKNATFQNVNAEKGFLHFNIQGEVAADGNMMSLLDASCQQTSVPEFAFYVMFYNCATLTSAPKLPATTLGRACYSGMFYGCSALTTAPELPAETLSDGCYVFMFHDCQNLNSVTVGFKDWNEEGEATTCWLEGTSETGTFTSPKELVISKRDGSQVPEGWTVVGGTIETFTCPDALCFTAKEAGAKLSLTMSGEISNPPALVYSTDGKNANTYNIGDEITLGNAGDKVYFSAKYKNATFSSDTGYLKFKISGAVAADGNTMSLLDASLQQTHVPDYAFQRLFANCSTLQSAPKLPATTLGKNCYAIMFSGCTALTTAPELPAETLSDVCYNRMFINCQNLNSVTVGFKYWNTEGNATAGWLSGVAEKGTFTCPKELVIKTRDTSSVPEGWTVVGGAIGGKIKGDVDGDGVVDIADVNAVLTVMFGGTEHSSEADVDGDGVVDIADVNAVLTKMFASE